MITKEEKFYSRLKDVFLGEKIEGESGYINLMKVKSRYYERGVLPKLKEYIDESTKNFPDFKEELFDKLYTFFNRYFSRSGSIYFDYTPLYQSVYEKIYTDDKDVILFWKTHMLYYVKTDRIFRNLKTEVDGFKFFFDVSSLEHKKATEKRELIYELKEAKEDGAVVFNVLYTEKGRKTKIDQIIKELKKKDIKIKSDTLERAFRVFERQSEVDYFINKNAKEFLREQFDLWLYQYVFKGKSEWAEKRIKQLQILEDIAYKIIDFISQFEDELVKIWNKPKFVFNSNYVITLDRILNPPPLLMGEDKGGGEQRIKIIEKILNHKNFKEQVKEWKELGIIEDKLKESDLRKEILKEDLTGKNLNEKYKFLPIDTKYFKDLEIEILSLFDNLDESLDGWLIKSENYQALNTLLNKFREKIQTIYIDPPFNKEQDADYFYSVKYKDATWITMLENRLKKARDLLKDTGSIFVRCDYNGNMYVRLLMNEIFGEENFRNEITVGRTKTAPYIGTAPEKAGVSFKSLMVVYDNIYLYSKTDNFFNKFSEGIIEEKREAYWKDFKTFFDRDYNRYELLGIVPEKGCSWMWRKDVAEEAVKNYEKYLEEYKKTGISLEDYWEKTGKKLNFIKKEGTTLKYWIAPLKKVSHNNWTELEGYGRKWHFPTENSEILLKRVIESTSNEGDLIMDFFLGSGTTCAVAHKLKRKWIGIEVGEHFYTVGLPRMKKVLFYDKSGISKEKNVKEKYNEKNAGGFFKYYELEQYEDVLRKAKYEDSDLFENPNEDVYNQYIFLKDPKMLECLEIDYEKNKVKVDFSKLYSKEKDGKEIDVIETLSNLLGKWIKKITRDYAELEDGTKIDLKNLEYIELPDGKKEMFYKYGKDLIWW